MRRSNVSEIGRLRISCVAAILMFFLTVPAVAQIKLSVRDLRFGFETQHKNELVEVHGWVSAERRVMSRTYKGYYVKDRYGDFLLIRTTQPLPEMNAELDVRGVAVRDADTNDIYVTETVRTLTPPAGPSVEEQRRREEEAARGQQRRREEERRRQEEEAAFRNKVLIGFGVAIVPLVGSAVYLILRRRDTMVAAPGSIPSPAPPEAAPWEPDGTVVENLKTVKVYKTTKVLPGRLVVVDNRQETDIIPLTDQSGRGEIEIGRDSPDTTGGIRIKDPTNTLSRRQARISYAAAARQFTVTNLASDASNPSALNGRQMGEGESAVLKDGDALVMGNVEMKFRQT